MAGTWNPLFDYLREHTDAGNRVTLTIKEIIAMTRSIDVKIRDRDFWGRAQRGAAAYDRLANAGYSLAFEPDERGRQVESVTFWRTINS